MQLAGVRVVDPCEALLERALSASVSPDDAKELSLSDTDADVADRLQQVERSRLERVQGALLERVVLAVRQLVRLADTTQRNRLRSPGERSRRCDRR